MHMLQLNSKDFRRLCILKGIQPREPKNSKQRPKGQDGTDIYYHKKDIEFLLSDTILSKQRSIKAHQKKVSKAKAYMDESKEKLLKEMTPYQTLNHIVRERQPTFKDALEDLDDALTLINLFAVMPTVKGDYNVNNELTEKAWIIANQFLAYCYMKKYVRKIFISIKGIQVNVLIQNTSIMFIVPHKFSRKLPETVDQELMQTFLEFQITLMNHVLCRLFKIDNFRQPPSIDKTMLDSSNCPSFMAFKIESLVADVDQSEIPQLTSNKSLMSDFTIFLSRETPFEQLSLILHSQGGTVTFNKSDSRITHIITDRDIDTKQYSNIDVAQSQWVADCCNFDVLLPVAEQAPGKQLPPHVSPFKTVVKDTEYLPERLKEILRLKGIHAKEMEDSEFISNQMLLEDDMEDEVEANDFSQLRREVQLDKEREKKQIVFGASSEQKGLQRLTLTSRKKIKHMTLFKEKRDKMKKIAQVKQRRLLKK